jgi:hypothetical protein
MDKHCGLSPESISSIFRISFSRPKNISELMGIIALSLKGLETVICWGIPGSCFFIF